jgi:hypothetical protein
MVCCRDVWRVLHALQAPVPRIASKRGADVQIQSIIVFCDFVNVGRSSMHDGQQCPHLLTVTGCISAQMDCANWS